MINIPAAHVSISLFGLFNMTHSINLKERQDFLSVEEGYLREGLYDKAIKLAKERLSRFPGDVDAWLVIASCRVNMGKLTAASEILKELEEVIRGWSLIYQCLGDIYHKKGLASEATQSYRKALNLNPDSQKKEQISGKISSAEKDSQSDELTADDEVSDIEQISSDFHTITLAELYIKQGHLTIARNVLKKIIKRDPQNTKVLKRLEYVETLMGKGKVNKQALIVEELNRWLNNL